MATVLAVMTLVTSAAVPSLDGYVLLAQQVRAQHDVRTLAVSMLRLRMDVNGQIHIPGGVGTYTLLVGDGNRPAIALGGDREWVLPPGAPEVGRLADHLVINRPDYRPVAIDLRSGWRGPYLDAPVIKSDPWGNRYALNAKGLQHGRPFAVIVLSAGPNGIIETPFDVNGALANGDDLYALVTGGR
jgi:hypothetical protein